MNTRSAAARDADEFFDFARYGLMLAEQIGDDVTRDNLLKLIRLVGGLTGCRGHQLTQELQPLMVTALVG
jgi:hypothetical protein